MSLGAQFRRGGRLVTKFPERYADAPGHILGALEHLSRHLAPRIICEACGCLCKPDEVCPGCRANRTIRDRLVAEAEPPTP